MTNAQQNVAGIFIADDDSSIFLDRVVETDGTVSIAVWGTEDTAPDVRLAYTYIPEADFIAWLALAGYTVTPPEADS